MAAFFRKARRKNFDLAILNAAFLAKLNGNKIESITAVFGGADQVLGTTPLNFTFTTTVKLGYNELLGTDPFFGVRYNRNSLCSKLTNLSQKSVRHNRVLVNNRVRYNRVVL